MTLRSFLGRRGDNFDRFLIRVKEVSESFRVLSQVVDSLSWSVAVGKELESTFTVVLTSQRPIFNSTH